MKIETHRIKVGIFMCMQWKEVKKHLLENVYLASFEFRNVWESNYYDFSADILFHGTIDSCSEICYSNDEIILYIKDADRYRTPICEICQRHEIIHKALRSYIIRHLSKSNRHYTEEVIINSEDKEQAASNIRKLLTSRKIKKISTTKTKRRKT